MGSWWDPAELDAVVQQEGVAALLRRLDAALGREEGAALQTLREAVAMSAAVLTDDPAQFPAQLVGRLSGDPTPEIRMLVDGFREFADRPWLCPEGATLTVPGAPLRRILRGTPDPVTAVAVSPDGRWAASGSYCRDVRVWDLEHGLLLAQYTGPRPGGSYAEGAGGDTIAALALVGDTVLAASADRCVYRIDRVTGAGEMVVQGETDNLFAVALSGDGGTLVAGPRDIWGISDYLVQVWDLRRGEQVRTLDGPGHPHEKVTVTSSGRRAGSMSRAGEVSVWDTATGAVLWTGVAGSVTALALSPDGGSVATGHEDGEVQVCRVAADGTPVAVATGDGAVHALAFAGANRVVCATQGGTVLVRDLLADSWIRCGSPQGSPVLTVAPAADDRSVVCGCVDGATRTWDLLSPGAVPERAETLTELGSVDPAVRERVEQLEAAEVEDDASSRHEVTAVAAAGPWALAASRHWTMIHFRLGIAREEARLRLWDTRSGEPARDLATVARALVHGGHVDAFCCAALDEDASLAAAGSADRTLRVWDTATGRLVAAFTGESAVTGCGFSGDGRLVMTEASGRVHRLALRGVPGGAPSGDTPSGGAGRAVGPLPARHDRRDPEEARSKRRGHLVTLGRKATARTIETYFDRFGLEAVRLSGTAEDDATCISVIGEPGHGRQVTVVCDAARGQLTFRVGGLLFATLDDTPADRIHGLLLALAVLNHRIPLGSFCYDPEDGEVSLRYMMPITSGEVRYDDFAQAIVVLDNILRKHAADLQAVVAGDRTAAEVLG